MLLPIFITGLVIGSFLGALTYRYPRGKSVAKGRSECPNCGNTIFWYDNIPAFSYIFLKGKCRGCKTKISRRYPIIEFATATFFSLAYIASGAIQSNIPWLASLGPLQVPLLLLIAALLVAVFVIDLEHQIIPDEVSFIGWAAVILALVLTANSSIFTHLATGFGSAIFLLAIHLLTKGKGMGLGDVKLALFMGTLLTPLMATTWVLTSFSLGAVLGIFLLSFKKAGFKDKVAFGPFMILSFIVIAIWGQALTNVLFPY